MLFLNNITFHCPLQPYNVQPRTQEWFTNILRMHLTVVQLSQLFPGLVKVFNLSAASTEG